MDSHAQIQVPDLHLVFLNYSKQRGAVWGPLNKEHGALVNGLERHHRAALLPHLDSLVTGAAQKHIGSEW